MLAWTLISTFAPGIIKSRLSWAQPPGTLPPSRLINPSPPGNLPPLSTTDPTSSNTPGAGTTAQSDASPPIQPKAFLFFDAAGNPVMAPGMTFEKLDRLMRLEDGLGRSGQRYSIESMSIAGRVDSGHAELTVTTRISVEPTQGAWISIPLRMGNFHRTGPADVSGVETYRMDLSEDGSGHLLRLKSETRRSVVVAMRVVVRVSPPPTAAIEFRLPETVCDISLNVPDADVSASIVGRGDEVLRTLNSGRSTSVKVESGGGSFSLRFGTQLPIADNRPVLETDSQILVDWQQGDNSPLAKIDMQIRNLRGDLPKVSLAVPGSLRLLQQPEVLNGGPFEVLDAVDIDPGQGNDGPVGVGVAGVGNRDGEVIRRIDLLPTTSRGDTEVEVSLDGQMRSEAGRPGGMVIVSSIAIDEAVEQKGVIEVRTPRDYRLRWTAHPWVRSIWEKADSDSLSSRVYRFRFDRVPFELPIWLSARARQMRVESELRVTLYESLASLRMTIKTSGSIPDSRILPIDVGSWTDQSVFIADTTTPVESDRTENTIEIDLASLPGGGNEGDRIEIVLVKPLVPGEAIIDLPIPRIAGNDESIGTLPSTLTVVSQNDSRFVVDLPASVGVGEVIRRGTAPTGTSLAVDDTLDENRYTLPDLAQETRLMGYLVRERPSVSVLADAEVSIIADRVTEVVNWTIYPQGGLRGRLPIAWGEPMEQVASVTSDSPTIESLSITESTASALKVNDKSSLPNRNANSADAMPTLNLSPIPPWTAVVDDAPAVIRRDADGRYQIYSDRLGSGPHRVRLRRTRSLPSMPTGETLLNGVYLPRPTLPDVTLRGPIVVRLRGSDQWALTAIESEGRTVDELKLSLLPQLHLPIEIKPIEKRDDDVVITRGVLRTAVGVSTQYEQFLATVEGGGTFRVGLAKVSGDVLARATVDGSPVELMRDANDRILIRLGDDATHRIDLQIWLPRSSAIATEQIHPIMMLPIGIERLYWQLIVPQDQHLVWATPTMGRAMRWELDRWRLNRVPLENDERLVAWAGVPTDALMPPGNRYLLVGIDAGSLAATTMTRQAMWLIVGAIVLITSCLLIYVPAFRHPLTAVFGSVALGGLMLLLPEAAVIAGQLVLVAMLIVAVMSGVRHLLLSRRGNRVFAPSREAVEQSTARHLGRAQDEPVDRYLPEVEPTIASGSVVETRT